VQISVDDGIGFLLISDALFDLVGFGGFLELGVARCIERDGGFCRLSSASALIVSASVLALSPA
jgi:hypothetical protein